MRIEILTDLVQELNLLRNILRGMSASGLESKSQLDGWFEKSLFVRVGRRRVHLLCCSRRTKVA